MKQIWIIIVLVGCLLSSCLLTSCMRRLEPKAPTQAAQAGNDPTAPQARYIEPNFTGRYIQDHEGGVFLAAKWYAYEFANHMIWPLHTIYYIQANNGITYQFQIRGYYDELSNETGYFTIATKRYDNDEIRTIKLDGSACGNTYTNPDYKNCIKDPKKNTHTYLNLETGESWKMSESEAKTSLAWDMAFKRTDILLNSGFSGPGNVRGAVGEQMEFFFKSDSRIDLKAAKRIDLKNRANDRLAPHVTNQQASFYLPIDIDRVMHESYWQLSLGSGDNSSRNNDPNGKVSANSNHWWIVKSFNEDSFIKTRIIDLDLKENQMTIEFFLQSPQDKVFQENSQKIIVSPSSGDVCIDFFEKKYFECLTQGTLENTEADQNPDWDIRITTGYPGGDGYDPVLLPIAEWTIHVNEGAFGPLTQSKADLNTSGRIAAP